MNITVLPMTIAVIIVSIGIYIMIRYYFNIMIENSAEIILKEIAALKEQMLRNTQVLSSEIYESQLDEILLIK
jgi:hypothetical protein